ncbi:hypothetical protein [Flavobacterium foetidum]|uniref:hypothetical protein n=1 Tax=Flavobacterium foetidum TaxID=2026681 RepID=UPI0010752351|nr:hypothetical protein [Flavobacterium foetidum]KAF2506622.1 hypothetical protein E0W73_20980 [Flavobacterium foetidum]
MKNIVLIMLLVFGGQCVYSQELKPEYHKFVKIFIENVKNNRKEEVAKMIKYPLHRDNPVPPIKNKTEFIKRYDEIFDEELKKEIVNSDPIKNWEQVGWRGIMLNSGTIWFEGDGKLKTINHVSKKEKAYKEKLIAAQKSKLHSSIKEFKEPLYVLETSKFRIRIDDLGNQKYRYASWPIKSNMSQKPDLILQNGKWLPDGTGGNSYFEFKKGNFVYQCYIIVLGQSDSPPATLTIYQNEKTILEQNAKIVSW